MTVDDYAVIECLIDLHVIQDSTCIGAKGSICENPKSVIGNIKVDSWIWAWFQPDDMGPIGKPAASKFKTLFASIRKDLGGMTMHTSSEMNLWPLRDDDKEFIFDPIVIRGSGADDC